MFLVFSQQTITAAFVNERASIVSNQVLRGSIYMCDADKLKTRSHQPHTNGNGTCSEFS